MQQIPLHPSLVHIPIALGMLMPLILLGLLVFIRRGSLPAGAWWIGTLLQAVLVFGAVTAIASGHREEERVEDIVPHAAIEAHEHLAGAMTGTALVTLLLAAVALRRTKFSGSLQIAALVGTVAVAGLAAVAGHQGGELVYRHGAAGVNPAQVQFPQATSPEEEESEGR